MRATLGRIASGLRTGEVFSGRFVAYETPAWPLTEIEYRPLEPSLSVRFHCDFPFLSGLSIRVRTSHATRLVLTIADASSTVVRRCSVRGTWLPGDEFAHFRFRVLAQSTGKDLTLAISCATAGTASIAVNRSKIVGQLRSDEGGIPQSLFYCSDKSLTQYALWIQRNEPPRAALADFKTEAASRGFLISIAVPVYKTPLSVLDAMIESVLDQTWPRWELCIADAGSPDEEIGRALDRWTVKDGRIHVIHLGENRGIAGNTNAALRLVTGAYVAFLDHDDTLAPFALSSIVQAIVERGEPDMLYSDEDKLDGATAHRTDPFFKPDWSPHVLMSHNYITHFLCIRKELVDSLGGLRSDFDGAQDYDLVLRCSERTSRIVHIPEILYHWRMGPSSTARSSSAKSYAYEAGRKALSEHLGRRGLHGEVVSQPVLGYYRTRLTPPQDVSVSVLIPSHDNPRLLTRAVETALGSLPAVGEVLVLENNSRRPSMTELYRDLQKDVRVHVLDYGSRPFNYSAINNWGASQATGSALLFLNDDVYARSRGWLEEMLQWLSDSTVGAIGACLLYPNGLVQHAGVVLGMGGVAGHRWVGSVLRDAMSSQNGVQEISDVSAATAACLLVRRRLFDEVGGFDEAFPLAYGDVDLCLRLRKRGYQVVYTPDAKLVHCESATRGSDFSPDRLPAFLEATREMWSRWGPELRSDPFYSPNLTLNESVPRIRMT
jgi:GT2 family glycosyltransferase